MIRPLRLVFVLSLALGFGASASALSFKPSIPFMAKRAPAQLDRAWAQDGSDLKPDEQVRFGTLPNGMRYAVMRNATPKGQASFRMRVGTGSLEETDNQQGLAHFLEHMAFNGSTKRAPRRDGQDPGAPRPRLRGRTPTPPPAGPRPSTSWTCPRPTRTPSTPA